MSDTSSRLPELLHGPRLTLRRWRVVDLEQMTALVAANVEHLRPWLPWAADEPLSRRDRLALLERWEGEWEAGGDVTFAIELRGALVGSTGLHRRRGPHGLEIGYWVDGGHLGRGIATEAAGILTTAALERPDVTFAEIRNDKANTASAAVPRRLGYRLAEELTRPPQAPAESGIECVWRTTLREWKVA
jgi:RimJ/RimL family protein N-acetyltransferase